MKVCLGWVFIAGVLSASSVSLAAPPSTVLEFKLSARDSDTYKPVVLSSLNKRLKAANLPPFGKTIILGKDGGPAWLELQAALERANTALGTELELMDRDYIGNIDGFGVRPCYRGPVENVMEVIDGLRGTMWNDSMGIMAYRYGTKKVVIYEGRSIEDDEETREFHKDENPSAVRAWDRFNTRGSDFLVLSDYGQNGDATELFATLIKACK